MRTYGNLFVRISLKIESVGLEVSILGMCGHALSMSKHGIQQVSIVDLFTIGPLTSSNLEQLGCLGSPS